MPPTIACLFYFYLFCSCKYLFVQSIRNDFSYSMVIFPIFKDFFNIEIKLSSRFSIEIR
mgnify:CR=1 FL=1